MVLLNEQPISKKEADANHEARFGGFAVVSYFVWFVVIAVPLTIKIASESGPEPENYWYLMAWLGFVVLPAGGLIAGVLNPRARNPSAPNRSRIF